MADSTDLGRMDAYRVYQRSLTMLFLRSAYEVLEASAAIRVQYTLDTNLYIEIDSPLFHEKPQEVCDRIRDIMQEHVRRSEPIEPVLVDLEEAKRQARQQGLDARVRLFSYRLFNLVHMYRFDGFQDYFYGKLLPDTSLLRRFDLAVYEEGIILLLPSREFPYEVEPVARLPKLRDVYERSHDWSRIVEVADIGALNEKIASGRIMDVIYTAEALHWGKIASIASQIAERRSVRLVLVAGPSSSGKTTFSKRLCVQLRAEGKKPHLISVDNYFKNREDTPRDENGEYDFECIEAVDTDLLQKDLLSLLKGETIRQPEFDFIEGKRRLSERALTLGENDILVMEGIHCLNDVLTSLIPAECKFKVYISALTQLSVDEHNRIPTTDGRLLRRMVRDWRTRGHNAQGTLALWASVRRGEDRNIFPYQEEADAMFNSALPYEMAVLKQYAEPLLYTVPEESPEYPEARRLLRFLDYFQAISGDEVPETSLLREFIGKSVYEKMEEG